MLKRARTLLFALAVAAVAVPLQTAAQQAGGADEAATPAMEVTPDVVYGHKDGMALTFDVIRPPNAHGAAVLYMVSGGWFSRWSPAERLARRTFSGLLENGITVLAVRHGSAPRYNVPEAEADVRRALRYVRLHADDLEIDEDRLGVFGGSAGGHLSLMLALGSDQGDETAEDVVLQTPARVAAVVAYYPPVDIRRMTGPSERFPALDFPSEQAAGISPILFVTEDDPPTLLIHGDADRLVNINHSERMYAALQEHDVESEFITIQGGAHGFPDPAHRDRAQAAMTEWFVQHLGPNAGN